MLITIWLKIRDLGYAKVLIGNASDSWESSCTKYVEVITLKLSKFSFSFRLRKITSRFKKFSDRNEMSQTSLFGDWFHDKVDFYGQKEIKKT